MDFKRFFTQELKAMFKMLGLICGALCAVESIGVLLAPNIAWWQLAGGMIMLVIGVFIFISAYHYNP